MSVLIDANQNDFRGRNDDGTETTATWIAALDTNFSQIQSANFRLRYAILMVSDPFSGTWTSVNTVKFQYNRNSLGWNDITSSSSVMRLFTSAHVADETATTQQISSGGFNAGNVLTSSTLTTNVVALAGNSFELEGCFQIIQANTLGGDTIKVQCVNNAGTVAKTITNTVTITVIEAPPPTTGNFFRMM